MEREKQDRILAERIQRSDTEGDNRQLPDKVFLPQVKDLPKEQYPADPGRVEEDHL